MSTEGHKFISLDHNCQVLPSLNKGVTLLHKKGRSTLAADSSLVVSQCTINYAVKGRARGDGKEERGGFLPSHHLLRSHSLRSLVRSK